MNNEFFESKINAMINKVTKVYDEPEDNYTFEFIEIEKINFYDSLHFGSVYGTMTIRNRWCDGDEDNVEFRMDYDEEGNYHIVGIYITFDYYGKF